MLVKLEVRYKEMPYCPAIYICDYYAFWNLWSILSISDRVSDVGVFDIISNEKLDMTKGALQSLCGQYRGD